MSLPHEFYLQFSDGPFPNIATFPIMGSLSPQGGVVTEEGREKRGSEGYYEKYQL
jgi:hypothetical protein